MLLTWKYSEKAKYWFIIYRAVNGSSMITYKNLKADQSSFADTGLKNGIYQYSIKAVYDDGGESKAIKSAEVKYVHIDK